MAKLLLELPSTLKAKLMAKKDEGYTASGYIRALLERDLMKNQVVRKRDAPWKTK